MLGHARNELEPQDIAGHGMQHFARSSAPQPRQLAQQLAREQTRQLAQLLAQRRVLVQAQEEARVLGKARAQVPPQARAQAPSPLHTREGMFESGAGVIQGLPARELSIAKCAMLLLVQQPSRVLL